MEASAIAGFLLLMQVFIRALPVTAGCGGSFSGTVVLTSPNYPDPYPDNSLCIWNLMAPDGYYYEFSDGFIWVEKEYDFVYIYYGTGTTGVPDFSFTGYWTFTNFSLAEELTIVFYSDSTFQDPGFNLSLGLSDSYSFDEAASFFDCGGSITDGGDIISPDYDLGQYPTNALCSWSLIATPGYHVYLTCTSLFLDDYYYNDMMFIYNSSNPGIASLNAAFAGYGCFNPIELGQEATIVFRSYSGLGDIGFEISFSSVAAAAQYNNTENSTTASTTTPALTSASSIEAASSVSATEISTTASTTTPALTSASLSEAASSVSATDSSPTVSQSSLGSTTATDSTPSQTSASSNVTATSVSTIANLSTAIFGGEYATIIYGSLYMLDAASMTIDLTSGGPIVGVTYIWQCRQPCENWTVYDYSYVNVVTPMTSSCNTSAIPGPPGCLLNGSSNDGTGTLSKNGSGILTLNTSELITDSTLFIRVIALKGNSSAVGYQMITFINTGTPNVSLSCLWNCKATLNPTDRLSVAASAEGYDAFSLIWNWSLYNVLPDSSMVVLPDALWVNFAPTGKSSSFISIGSGFWGQQSPNSKFALAVQAFPPGLGTNFAGIDYHAITISSAPQAGNCSLTPKNGTAVTTKFNVTCTNFMTVNPPLSYQIGYSLDGLTYTWVRSGSGLDKVGQGLTLPKGQDEGGFVVYVAVSATDCIGMSTTTNVSVQVYGPSSSQLSSLLSAMAATSDLAVLGLDPSQPAAAIAFVGALALTLNSIDTSGSNNDTAIGLTEVIAAREWMTSILLQAPMADAQSLIGIQSVLSGVLGNPSQVSSKTRESSSALLAHGAGVFANISVTSMSGSQMKTALSASISTAGNLAVANTFAATKSQTGVDISASIVSSLETMSDAVLLATVPNDDDVIVSSSTLTMVVSKKYASSSNGGMAEDAGGSGVTVPDFSLSSYDTANATIVKSQVNVFQNNPYAATDNRTSVDSGVIMIKLSLDDTSQHVDTQNLIKPVHVISARTKTISSEATNIQGTASAPLKDASIIHKIKMVSNQSIFISLDWYQNKSTGNYTSNKDTGWSKVAATNYSLVVFMSVDNVPSWKLFDFYCTLPVRAIFNDSTNKTEVLSGGVYSTFCIGTNIGQSKCNGEFILGDLSNYPEYDATGIDYTQCYLPATYLNKKQGTYLYVTVSFLQTSMLDTSVIPFKYSTSPDTSTDSMALSYSGYSFSQPCVYWNRYTLQWNTDGCMAGPLTTMNQSHCLCTRVSVSSASNNTTKIGKRKRSSSQASTSQAGIAFGSGISLSINAVNFKDSAFNHLDDNPLIFSVMLSIMCIYLCILVWAVKKDKLDEWKAAVIPLIDNEPADNYLYEVTVYTGNMIRAGTTARVCMVFSGEDGESEPRIFCCEERQIFQRGGIDKFLMAAPKSLGSLAYIRIWHDNCGRSPSWFVSRIVVVDMQTSQKFYFVINKWFSETEDDCLRCRLINVAGRSDMTTFGNIFWIKVRKDLGDGHVWFSVIGRPHTSRFTRVERLTCCLTLLFSLMTANIMFYGKIATTDIVIQMGPLTISIAQIIQGIIASLVVLPINIIVVQVFRRTEPMHVRKILQKSRSNKILSEIHGPLNPKSSQDSVESPNNVGSRNGTFKHHVVTSEGHHRSPWNILAASVSGNLVIPTAQLSGARAQADVQVLQLKNVNVQQFKRTTNLSRKRLLPWWCVFIAYFLCLATWAVSFWYVVEIGNVLGQESATKWLVSFITSVIESICVSQPIKVIIIAIAFSIIIKRPANDDDSVVHRGKRAQYLDEHLKKSLVSSARIIQAIRNKLVIPGAPTKETVEAVEQKRLHEAKIIGVLQEIGIYLIFIMLMMMRSYGNLDVNSEPAFRHAENNIRSGLRDQSSWIATELDLVHDYSGVWKWLSKTVVPSIYPDNASFIYSSPVSMDMRTPSGFVPVGQPRLRQIRIRQGETCTYQVSNRSMCYSDFSSSGEDTSSYGEQWLADEVAGCGNYSSAWTWTSAFNGSGDSIIGMIGSYPGSGFSINLGSSARSALATLTYLTNNSWLDRKTRALTVEFATFNPNINLVAVSFILLEFSVLGVVLPTYSMSFLRYEPYVRDGLAATLVAEIGCIAFSIYMAYQEFSLIRKLKKKYFQSSESVLNMATLILCLVAIILFVVKHATLGSVKASFKSDTSATFISFQSAAFWSECYRNCLGLTTFIATLKLLRLLRFNNRISMLTTTLRSVMATLIWFMLLLVLVLFAFAHMTTIIFGGNLEAFSSFYNTVIHLIVLMMNKFDYVSLEEVNPVFAPTFLLGFVMFVNFIMLSVIMTVIMEGFQSTREELRRTKNKHDIFEYIVKAFKTNSGLGQVNEGPPVTTSAKRKTKKLKKLRKDLTRNHGEDEVSELAHAFKRLQLSIDKLLRPVPPNLPTFE